MIIIKILIGIREISKDYVREFYFAPNFLIGNSVKNVFRMIEDLISDFVENSFSAENSSPGDVLVDLIEVLLEKLFEKINLFP